MVKMTLTFDGMSGIWQFKEPLFFNNLFVSTSIGVYQPQGGWTHQAGTFNGLEGGQGICSALWARMDN